MKIDRSIAGLVLFLLIAVVFTVIPMIIAIRSNHP